MLLEIPNESASIILARDAKFRMPKQKKKSREIKKKGIRQVITSAWKQLLSGFTVVALVGLTLNYKYNGADGLRTEIYQPLFKEITTVEQALQANHLTINYTGQTLDSLQKTGQIQRIPSSLRTRILDAYQKAGIAYSHVFPMSHFLEMTVPEYVKQVRTEQSDKEWVATTILKLNDAAPMGPSPYLSTTFQHAGASPAIDNRDPNHPRIGHPGTIHWQINDWLRFPESAKEVNQNWTDVQFVDFHDIYDRWDYRITRQDLNAHQTDLQNFLDPIYRRLVAQDDFKRLMAAEKDALRAVQEVKQRLGQRVDDPKSLLDLFDW